MLERAELASLVSSVDIRSPDILESRIATIQAIADLYGRGEPPKGSSSKRGAIKSEDLSLGDTVHHTEVGEADLFPVRCHELQCLFCIGDKQLNPPDRTRTFCRLQKL